MRFQLVGAVAVVTMLGAGACSGADDATDSTTASSPASPTQAPSSTEVSRSSTPPTEPSVTITPSTSAATATTPARGDLLHLELVGCERFGIAAPADPTVAGDLVGTAGEVRVDGGSARFALQMLSCDDLVTDGVSHGPGHFGTAWIGLVAPDVPPELPAESNLVAQATDAFYPALFQTDNEGFHDAMAAFGVPMSMADSMTFDPTDAGLQTGSVLDTDHAPPVAFRWSVDNLNWNDTSVGTGRHTLFGLDEAGDPLIYYGEFDHEPGWMGNVGVLEFDEGSAFHDLVGPTVTAPANGDDISVSMVVHRVTE